MRLTFCAALAIAALPAAARAEFSIAAARIAEGDLIVMGRVDEPNTEITLDDAFTERTDARGRFTFRVAYHPSTCVVVLKAAAQRRSVVVGNCGQIGPRGEPGPVGPQGDRGERGPMGPPGPAADLFAEPAPPARGSPQRGALPGAAERRGVAEPPPAFPVPQGAIR